MINLIYRIIDDLERDGLHGKAVYWHGELESLLEAENINKVCKVGDIRRELHRYDDRQHVTVSVNYGKGSENLEVASCTILDEDTEDKSSPCIHVELI